MGVRKLTYTLAVPADATPVTVKVKGVAVPHVRYRDSSGRVTTAPLVKTKLGDRIQLESEHYYADFYDKDGVRQRVKLSTDRAVAEMMLGDLRRDKELGKADAKDPFAEHNKRPLAEHVADYRRALSNKSRTPTADYVGMVISRLTTLFDGCGFARLSDISGSHIEEWLAKMRRAGSPRAPLDPGKEQYTAKEAATVLGLELKSVGSAVRRQRLAATGTGKARRFPRETVEALQDRAGRGMSVQTSNYYLRHAQSICRWLVKTKRMRENPLLDLEAGNVAIDRRHDRRELTADELRSLLTVTRTSTLVFRGLTGHDRFMLYATACGTGFRASALASLTPRAFALDGDKPTVTLAARENKSRKPRVQPIPPDVADLLRNYLRGKPDGAAVWAGTGTWARDHRGAEMLRNDLDAAGIPYSVEGPDGPLFADFHALRHTYLTLLGKGGVGIHTAQELAGHSTSALTARYTHLQGDDLAGAVGKLPGFLPATVDPLALRLSVTCPIASTTTHSVASGSISEEVEGAEKNCCNPLTDKSLSIRPHSLASGCIGEGEDRLTAGDRLIRPEPSAHNNNSDNDLRNGPVPSCPQLVRIVAAWPSLPADIRTAILALIDAPRQ